MPAKKTKTKFNGLVNKKLATCNVQRATCNLQLANGNEEAQQLRPMGRKKKAAKKERAVSAVAVAVAADDLQLHMNRVQVPWSLHSTPG